MAGRPLLLVCAGLDGTSGGELAKVVDSATSCGFEALRRPVNELSTCAVGSTVALANRSMSSECVSVAADELESSSLLTA